MSDPVWQHTTDGDGHVDDPSTPPAVDPLQALQQLAGATDQPAAQAAAVALDALVKFLVTAGSEDSAQPLAVQPVAVAPAVVQPVPVVSPAEPVVAEVVPVAPVPPAAPEPNAPEPIAAPPEGELVELWPSNPIVDENARVRSDIDDALMPRSLALDEQIEFMENPPGWTPPVFDSQIPPNVAPSAVEPTPAPQPDPQPAPQPAAPAAAVEVVPAPPVAPEPPAPVPAPPVQPAPIQPAPVQQAAPAVLVVPAVPVVPAIPVPVAAPPAPVQQVIPVAPVAPAAPVAPVAVPVQQVVPVQPVVVAVPVVAAQPAVAEPPVAPAQPAAPRPAVPFWKRDVSLGKKKQKPAAAAVVAAPATPKQSVPFWKRELSLGKKKQPQAATVAATAVAPAETPPAAPAAPKPSVPFWKRELSLGKKKQPQAATVAATAVAPTETAPVTPAAPKQSVPFWKRELSLGKKKLSAPKAPKLAGAKEKIPFFKREIDLAGIANMPIGHQDGTTEGLDEIVGLRIGSSQIAAALVSNNGHAELERLARSPLKAGIVVGGEVHDTDALASALKAFFAQHKLPKRGVRIGVATNRIGVRVMEVPAVEDPKAAANAIRFRAQEVLPFALSEAVVDHVDLGEGPNDTRRVLIAFAHRGLIDQYVEACKRAKLKLAGIDFDAFALLRAVTAKRAEDDDSKQSAVVALAIGHERTIFAVSDGVVCEFTRVLDWGGAALDAAIAEALEITPEEAEQVKLGLSLTGETADGDLTPEQVEAARHAIRESLQLLARELVASLQFYQSRPGSLDIGDVLVTGGGAGLSGLDGELTRMLGVPVHTANPFAGVTVPEGLDVPDQSGSLAIAVGLGIEEQH